MSSVDATATRVAEYLADLGVSRVDERTFVAKRGSAVVGVRVIGEDDDSMVQVRANVVEGANLTVDVLRQLLEYNYASAYGAFGLAEGGVVTFHHCLDGASLDKEELVEVILEVAKVADDWDDVIVEQAGGRTAIDRLRELNKPKAQPTIEPAPPAAESEEAPKADPE